MNFGRGGGHMGGGGGMVQPPPGLLGSGPPSGQPQQQQPIIGEPFIPGQSSIKTRDILYRLVISQLFYDGYQQVAVALSNIGMLIKIQESNFDFPWTYIQGYPCKSRHISAKTSMFPSS